MAKIRKTCRSHHTNAQQNASKPNCAKNTHIKQKQKRTNEQMQATNTHVQWVNTHTNQHAEPEPLLRLITASITDAPGINTYLGGVSLCQTNWVVRSGICSNVFEKLLEQYCCNPDVEFIVIKYFNIFRSWSHCEQGQEAIPAWS